MSSPEVSYQDEITTDLRLLLTDLGGPCYYVKVMPSTNPANGPTETTTGPINVALTQSQSKFAGDGEANQYDRRGYVMAGDLTTIPARGDRLTDRNNQVWNVVGFGEKQINGITIVYVLQLKR